MECVSIRQKLGHRESVRITEEERKHLVDMDTDWKAGLIRRANQNESKVEWRGQAEGGKDGMRRGCVECVCWGRGRLIRLVSKLLSPPTGVCSSEEAM